MQCKSAFSKNSNWTKGEAANLSLKILLCPNCREQKAEFKEICMEDNDDCDFVTATLVFLLGLLWWHR